MKLQKLASFAQGPHGNAGILPFTLEAGARIEKGVLRLVYEFRGDFSTLHWTNRGAEGGRKEGVLRRDELWQTTCVEAFIQAEGETGYVEVNLAPNGDWNVYRFLGYRESMTPAAMPTRPTVRTEEIAEKGAKNVQDKLRRVSAELDLAPLFGARLQKGARFRLGLSAVIETRESEDGRLYYLALRHAGVKPDFHLAESFALVISTE